jgi:hypothetical protein
VVYLFVDETGDPGKKGSKYFGMALLEVSNEHYKAIESVISSYRLLSGMFAEFKELPQRYIVGLNLLRGISSLAEVSLVQASGIYIEKTSYSGRYLTWSDYGISEKEWAYYLRNYLIRHLLEYHFENRDIFTIRIDLVLDRILLTESQRANTISYLNSEKVIQLETPFCIPRIEFLTIADSKYVCCLQISHILADLVKNCAQNSLTDEQSELMKGFFKIKKFDGTGKPSDADRE